MGKRAEMQDGFKGVLQVSRGSYIRGSWEDRDDRWIGSCDVVKREGRLWLEGGGVWRDGACFGVVSSTADLNGILSEYCCTCIVYYSVQCMLLSVIPLPQCN